MISIVIVNYNDWNTTISFVKQIESYSILDHIIIVDNCSTDNSFVMLKKLAISPKIDVIKSAQNGGYGMGNNVGVDLAYKKYNSEYVIISNSDVIVEEKVVLSLVKEMENNKNISAMAPVMCNSKGKEEPNCAWKLQSTKWGFFAFNTPLLNRIVNKNLKFYLQNNSVDSNIVQTEAMAGSFFIIRTEDFMQVGGFDEKIFLYYEETVLGIKLKQINKKLAILKNEKFIHNHSSSISKSYKSKFKRDKLLWESKKYVLKAYYDSTDIELVLFALLRNIFGLIGLVRALFVFE